MNSVNHQLFVYGTLRSGLHHPAYEYISNKFVLAGEARVKGRLYDMGDYPAAIPTKDEYYIVGELYQLKEDQDFSWVIAQIDDYEGVNPEPGEPVLYKREMTHVEIGGKISSAWIYWYNSDISGKPIIESGDVLQYIQQKK